MGFFFLPGSDRFAGKKARLLRTEDWTARYCDASVLFLGGWSDGWIGEVCSFLAAMDVVSLPFQVQDPKFLYSCSMVVVGVLVVSAFCS